MFPMFVGLLDRKAKAKSEPIPVVAPAPLMSPKDELALLERSVLEKGMTRDELEDIQLIGECPEQVQTRIATLHGWHASR